MIQSCSPIVWLWDDPPTKFFNHPPIPPRQKNTLVKSGLPRGFFPRTKWAELSQIAQLPKAKSPSKSPSIDGFLSEIPFKIPWNPHWWWLNPMKVPWLNDTLAILACLRQGLRSHIGHLRSWPLAQVLQWAWSPVGSWGIYIYIRYAIYVYIAGLLVIYGLVVYIYT